MSLATFAHPSIYSSNSKENLGKDEHRGRHNVSYQEGKSGSHRRQEMQLKTITQLISRIKNEKDESVDSKRSTKQTKRRKRNLSSNGPQHLPLMDNSFYNNDDGGISINNDYRLSNKELLELIDFPLQTNHQGKNRYYGGLKEEKSTDAHTGNQRGKRRRKKRNRKKHWSAPEPFLPCLLSLPPSSSLAKDRLDQEGKEIGEEDHVELKETSMVEDHGTTFLTSSALGQAKENISLVTRNRISSHSLTAETKSLLPSRFTSESTERVPPPNHGNQTKRIRTPLRVLLRPRPHRYKYIEPKPVSSPSTKMKLYLQRDERIEKAKHVRRESQQNQLVKLVSKLEKRDQTRKYRALQQKRRRRESTIVWTMTLASKLHFWLKGVPELVEGYRRWKALDNAALVIQNIWRKEVFVRKAMEAHKIKKELKTTGWRLKIWLNCTRRRLNAQLIRRFFKHFKEHLHMNYVIYSFRTRVLRAQRLMRNFIICKDARINMLQKYWTTLERQITQKEEMKTRTKRRRNNLLKAAITARNGGGTNNGPSIKNNTLASSNMMNLTVELLKRPKAPLENATSFDKVDPHLQRAICRLQLEDCRRFHIKTSIDEINKCIRRPILNQSHAKILLSGEELNIDWEAESVKWPEFMVYRRSKDYLQKSIETVRNDDSSIRNWVEKRLMEEKRTERANRFNYESSEYKPTSNLEQGGDTTRKRMNRRESAGFKGINTEDELREIFELVDLDNGGTLSIEELGKLFDLLGMHKKEEDIIILMNKMIGNDNGMVELSDLYKKGINFKQFANALHTDREENKIGEIYSEDAVLLAFDFFAKAGSHTLTDEKTRKIKRHELMEVLQSFEGKWDEHTASSMLRDAGLTGNTFDYEEFIKLTFLL